jgi:hypothetical protein
MKLGGLQLVYGGIQRQILYLRRSCVSLSAILQQPLTVSSELNAFGDVACILSAFVSNQEALF